MDVVTKFIADTGSWETNLKKAEMANESFFKSQHQMERGVARMSASLLTSSSAAEALSKSLSVLEKVGRLGLIASVVTAVGLKLRETFVEDEKALDEFMKKLDEVNKIPLFRKGQASEVLMEDLRKVDELLKETQKKLDTLSLRERIFTENDKMLLSTLVSLTGDMVILRRRLVEQSQMENQVLRLRLAGQNSEAEALERKIKAQERVAAAERNPYADLNAIKQRVVLEEKIAKVAEARKLVEMRDAADVAEMKMRKETESRIKLAEFDKRIAREAAAISTNSFDPARREYERRAAAERAMLLDDVAKEDFLRRSILESIEAEMEATAEGTDAEEMRLKVLAAQLTLIKEQDAFSTTEIEKAKSKLAIAEKEKQIRDVERSSFVRRLDIETERKVLDSQYGRYKRVDESEAQRLQADNLIKKFQSAKDPSERDNLDIQIRRLRNQIFDSVDPTRFSVASTRAIGGGGGIGAGGNTLTSLAQKQVDTLARIETLLRDQNKKPAGSLRLN